MEINDEEASKVDKSLHMPVPNKKLLFGDVLNKNQQVNLCPAQASPSEADVDNLKNEDAPGKPNLLTSQQHILTIHTVCNAVDCTTSCEDKGVFSLKFITEQLKIEALGLLPW